VFDQQADTLSYEQLRPTYDEYVGKGVAVA
jgi:hypothetical protein